MQIVETEKGSIIEIWVKPRSSAFKVEVTSKDIIVYSTEEPSKGKVNRQIVKEFARFFGTRVEIVSGLTSQQKRLLVNGIGRKEVEERLLGGFHF